MVCLPTTAGCVKKRLVTVPVFGKITLDGGRWPRSGRIYFTPVRAADGAPRLLATAEFDVDGKFTVRTLREGDGVVPGEYRMYVECWDKPLSMTGPPEVSLVPLKYRDPTTSGLSITVKPGDKAKQLDLNLSP